MTRPGRGCPDRANLEVRPVHVATAAGPHLAFLRSGSGFAPTGKTVFLKAKGSSQRVRASVAYVASSRTIVLTPRHRLGHRTVYRFTIKSVRDVAGNPWDQMPGKAGARALTNRSTTV